MKIMIEGTTCCDTIFIFIFNKLYSSRNMENQKRVDPVLNLSQCHLSNLYQFIYLMSAFKLSAHHYILNNMLF